MSFLSNLTPHNLQEEKAKFFADVTYNPQFVYQNPVDPTELNKYGLPRPEHLKIAEKILNQTITLYDHTKLKLLQGRVLTDQEVKDTIENFLALHNLEKRFSVTYSASFISRTSATSDQLKIRLPMEYRRRSLQGMLYHEIGTHALRRVNYELQPWYRRKNQLGFSEYLETEEGLATLHSRLPHKYKAAVSQALHYVSISTALNHSFSEVWHTIRPYSESFDQCWVLTLRAKRGLTDTARPGAFTKDILYLDGMIRVWNWLKQRDFDCTELYFGKMDVSDVQKAVDMHPEFIPQLPFFFTKDRAKYQTGMMEIGRVNGLVE